MEKQEACNSNCDILEIDAAEWEKIKQHELKSMKDCQQAGLNDELKAIAFDGKKTEKKCVDFSEITFYGNEFQLEFKWIEHLTFRNCKFQEFYDGVMTANHIGQMEFFDCTFKECKRYIDVTGKVSRLYVENLLPKRDARVMLKDCGVVARLRDVGHLKLCRTNFFDCNVEYLPRGEYLTIDTQCNCQFRKIASDNVKIEGECNTEKSCPIYEDECK